MQPNQFLENVLKKIQISPEREKQIKNSVKKVFDKFKEIEPNCYNYRFGGSFKRYTNIRNYFDVDVYFIGHYQEKGLMNYFINRLNQLERVYKPFKVARKASYLHAIPSIFNNDFELDCLAAIELDKGYYKIPEGNRIIKINPNLDEKKLTKLNQNNDGRGTKVIRLLKKWNAINEKPFKSYQLEALTFNIFEAKRINALDKGLKTFFIYGISFLKTGGQIFDDVDKHPILKGLKRKKALNLMEESLKFMQQENWTKFYPTI